MSSSRPTAYSVFVQNIACKRRRAGQSVHLPKLFQELDKDWKALPEEAKQRYKDEAADRRNQGSRPTAQLVKPEPKTPTTSSASSSSPQPCEIKSSPLAANQIQLIDDSKRCIKREHEASIWDSKGSEEKKPKPGIPGWYKQKGMNLSNPREYMDAHLLELREKCNSIFSTQELDFTTLPLYSFSCNVLCRYRKNNQDAFVPLEVGICNYTIKDGKLGQPYHALINAGQVPPNSLNEALDHAENHKIPFPPKYAYPTEARSDYRKIYREMLDFAKGGERTILISSARDLHQVKGTLEWIHEKACEEPGKKLSGPGTWTILPVVEFVASMFNHVYQNMLHQPVPTALHYKLQLALEGSSFDYDDNLMCKFHKLDDNSTKWCAQSCAMRSFLNLEQTLDEILQNYIKATSSVVLVIEAYPDHKDQPEQLPAANSEAKNEDNQLSEPEPTEDQLKDLPASQDIPLAIEAPRQFNYEDDKIY